MSHCKNCYISDCKSRSTAIGNRFILELAILLRICVMPESSATATIDTIEFKLLEPDTPIITSIALGGPNICDGEGCSGAQAFISPDKRFIQIFFPAFFASVTGDPLTGSCQEKNCTLHINIETDGVNCNGEIKFILIINGAMFLDDDSLSNILVNCEKALTVNRPFANAYTVEVNDEETPCDTMNCNCCKVTKQNNK